jgi:hypothetical protein
LIDRILMSGGVVTAPPLSSICRAPTVHRSAHNLHWPMLAGASDGGTGFAAPGERVQSRCTMLLRSSQIDGRRPIDCPQ